MNSKIILLLSKLLENIKIGFEEDKISIGKNDFLLILKELESKDKRIAELEAENEQLKTEISFKNKKLQAIADKYEFWNKTHPRANGVRTELGLAINLAKQALKGGE